MSRFNPDAVRGVDGIWNQDTLPITDWEAADQRVVLPVQLQRSVGDAFPPVLRWSQIKYQNAVTKHHRVLSGIRDISRHLVHCRYHGQETGSHMGNQRALFPDHTGRWYALTIGPDRNHSYNVVTLIGGSDKHVVLNRLRSLENVVTRER